MIWIKYPFYLVVFNPYLPLVICDYQKKIISILEIPLLLNIGAKPNNCNVVNGKMNLK